MCSRDEIKSFSFWCGGGRFRTFICKNRWEWCSPSFWFVYIISNFMFDKFFNWINTTVCHTADRTTTGSISLSTHNLGFIRSPASSVHRFKSIHTILLYSTSGHHKFTISKHRRNFIYTTLSTYKSIRFLFFTFRSKKCWDRIATKHITNVCKSTTRKSIRFSFSCF